MHVFAINLVQKDDLVSRGQRGLRAKVAKGRGALKGTELR